MRAGKLANVNAGEPISAAGYNKLVDTANSVNDLLQAVPAGGMRLPPTVVRIKNITEQTTFATGACVALDGWGNGYLDGYGRRQETQTTGLLLAATLPSPLQRYRPMATAITLEMIQPNAIGLASVPSGICAAGVRAGTPYSDTASYARVITDIADAKNVLYSSLTLDAFGEYLVVAHAAGGWRGSEPADVRWCALVPVCDYGHFTGVLKEDFVAGTSGEASAIVRLVDNSPGQASDNNAEARVYCPLLSGGESISAGTTVLFSRNNMSGRWEIIAASCPTT